MKRRGSNLIVIACFIAMACVDLSAPAGPASISVLELPSTFVVRGDVMRDSLGNPAPPRVMGFNQRGDSSLAAATFFITDSVTPAHVGQNNIIVGDSFGIAHVIGQIGNLQTPVYPLPVTVAPTTIANTLTPATDTLNLVVASDSAGSKGSLTVSVKVSGLGDTTVQGVWVRFAMASSPASKSGVRAFVFVDDQSNNPSLSSVDTTDASGAASRILFGVSAFLADDSLRVGRKTDSVVVIATAIFRGKNGTNLINSPLRIVIPVKVSFPKS
ncbi:MAG TPA: hypothetical protein VH277_01840 [Gemmatimonadaceae bacterium]|nr:hypothetical protein [Gemmatimonadaceae bacterium]